MRGAAGKVQLRVQVNRQCGQDVLVGRKPLLQAGPARAGKNARGVRTVMVLHVGFGFVPVTRQGRLACTGHTLERPEAP